MTQSTAADAIFRALADPTRRKVLERLARGPASVTELAEPFEMKLPSFIQHLGVLEQCRLVKSSKKGRVRVYRLNPRRLQVAEDWLTEQRRLWEARLDRLDDYLRRLNEKEENP